uniref:Metallothionein n=1 Tax=Russula atropurpurea TaxID=152952 RepID=U6BJ83_9AGAM|nr:metallothionein [Russula atropurpurea]
MSPVIQNPVNEHHCGNSSCTCGDSCQCKPGECKC